LRRFAKVGEIPEAKEIYRFLSRFGEEQFVGFFFRCFELDMCQKGKKQGANRRFYRRVVGPEQVQEKR